MLDNKKDLRWSFVFCGDLADYLFLCVNKLTNNPTNGNDYFTMNIAVVRACCAGEGFWSSPNISLSNVE